MGFIAAIDWVGTVGLLVLLAVFAWLLMAGGTDSASSDDQPDPADPNAPDAQGFTPADKYGYGYDYSWGDPYGDEDL